MRFSCAIVLFTCALLLAGCSGTPFLTSAASGPVPGAAISGRVHGGQSPVVGAHVYLLAVNSSSTSTYGGPGIPDSSTNQSQSVLTSGDGQDSLGYYVITDSNGDFNITSDYTCPSSYSHPYLYSKGGFPGGGTSNSAIVLTAPVSSCGGSSEFIVIDEVSTIVTAYAFAGFASDPTHVSASNSSLAATNLDNAANTVPNLEDPMTGQAYGNTPAGNGTIPLAEINTLANILAACVNSSGSTSTQCEDLSSWAENGTTPAPDTATAALNIAHNPGANVANLYSLQFSMPPFQPMLTSSTPPNDFTIAITYTGGGIQKYSGWVAIDGSGDVWVTNNPNFYPPETGGGSVSEFTPLGAPVAGSPFSGGGIANPQNIAIDKSENVWVGDPFGSLVSELSNSGLPVSGSPYTEGGISDPWGIAFDQSGNAWIADQNSNSISELSSTGSPVTNSPFSGGGVDFPSFIAVDTSNDIWVTSEGGNSVEVSELNSSGSPVSMTGYYVGTPGCGLLCAYEADAIALGLSNDVWVTVYSDPADASIFEYNNSGTLLSPTTGDIGGGLDAGANSIAVDGAGNVWANSSNSTGPDVVEFNSKGTAITGSTGYVSSNMLDGCGSVSIDGSGNVWIACSTNITDSVSQADVIEFVGAASPVVTPIVANLLPPYGSAPVNLP